MRIVLPEVVSPSISKRCAVSLCDQTTREGKPYCPDHVHKNPYVKELVATIEQMEEEKKAIKLHGLQAVSLHTLLLHEVILYLAATEKDSVSQATIARDLSTDQEVIDCIVQRLRAEGLAEVAPSRRSKRRSNCVTLQKHPKVRTILKQFDEQALRQLCSPEATFKRYA